MSLPGIIQGGQSDCLSAVGGTISTLSMNQQGAAHCFGAVSIPGSQIDSLRSAGIDMAPPSKLKEILAKFESNINGTKLRNNETPARRPRNQPAILKQKENAVVIVFGEHVVQDASSHVKEQPEHRNGSQSSADPQRRAKVGFADCVKFERDPSTRKELASPNQEARPDNSVKSLAAFFELQCASQSERKSLGNRSIQSAPEKSTKLYKKWSPPGIDKSCSLHDSDCNKSLTVSSEHIQTSRSNGPVASPRRVMPPNSLLKNKDERVKAVDLNATISKSVERSRPPASVPCSARFDSATDAQITSNAASLVKGSAARTQKEVKDTAFATASKPQSPVSSEQPSFVSSLKGDVAGSSDSTAELGPKAPTKVRPIAKKKSQVKSNPRRSEAIEVGKVVHSEPVPEPAAMPQVQSSKTDSRRLKTQTPAGNHVPDSPTTATSCEKGPSTSKVGGAATATSAPATPKRTSKAKTTKASPKKTTKADVVSDPSLSETSPDGQRDTAPPTKKKKKSKSSAGPPVTKTKKKTKKVTSQAATTNSKRRKNATDPCSDISPLVQGKETDMDCHASFCMTESPLEYRSLGFASTSNFSHDSDDDSTIMLEFDFEDDYSIGEESAFGQSFASSTADFLCHLIETKERSKGGKAGGKTGGKTRKCVPSTIVETNHMSSSCTSGTEAESCSSFDGSYLQNDKTTVAFDDGSRRPSSIAGRR